MSSQSYIQIMPCNERLFAVYLQDDGTCELARVVAWGLDKFSAISALVVDYTGGNLYSPIDCSNFVGLVDEDSGDPLKQEHIKVHVQYLSNRNKATSP